MIQRALCLLDTEVEFMSTRLSVSVDIKHKQYNGEYEIDGGILYVFFEGRNKSSAAMSPSPDLVARLLLIELIFQAPSWRDHHHSGLTAHISPQG